MEDLADDHGMIISGLFNGEGLRVATDTGVSGSFGSSQGAWASARPRSMDLGSPIVATRPRRIGEELGASPAVTWNLIIT